MRLWIRLPLLMLATLGASGAQPAPSSASRAAGVRLDAISWESAATRLHEAAIVVLPLGAGSVAHGPHLPLGTEHRLAEYLTRRIVEEADVVVAPTLPYHYAPGFVEYPGSTSLALTTARDVTADVVRSLARYGPRRFYVLNTSDVSSRALEDAARLVAREGILLRYTDPRARLETAARALRQQPLGGHADEIETSMMLFVDPSAVDMSKATRELGIESTPLHLTRRQGGRGTYAPTGVWGDATIATREKGATFVEALIRAIRSEIEDLRRTQPPGATSTPRAGPPVPRPDTMRERPSACTAGDERTIRSIGPAYAYAWANQNPIRLSGLWNADGDMVHPDGFVERSAQTIRENRAALFMRPEYRDSRHGLYIGDIRCLTADVAVADAKWDLRGMTDVQGKTIPALEGLSTLVLKRRDGGWGIAAYRYTIKQPQTPQQPTLLNRPGFADTIR